MLRIHFTGEDLRRVVVAGADPLWDVLLSLHMLQGETDPLIFGEWRRRVRAAANPAFRQLLEIARPWGYSPDFLTPTRGDAGLEAQIDMVCSTPRGRVRAEISHLACEAPVSTEVAALAGGDAATMRRLGEAMSRYYQQALLPYRQAMTALISADRDQRSRSVLSGGVDGLLATLHPRVVWQSPVLQVPIYVNQDVYLQGRGLVLVPSLFLRIQPLSLMDPSLPPVLVYPVAPSLGWLRSGGAAETRGSVSALIGGTRAAVLASAVRGGTTSELAARLNIAPPVVSRHATVLRRAGLLESRRRGGSVLHRATALGLAVLDGELPTAAAPATTTDSAC
ncbi:ArsR/SmtB family transcription factor [Streptomyces sp. NPDC002187]|uniref:ArsR/SmtB family transcription factor n=1 Tax=Streptomyces sp. NPDC002187 TaxID=3364637 RepID=UPI00367975AE